MSREKLVPSSVALAERHLGSLSCVGVGKSHCLLSCGLWRSASWCWPTCVTGLRSAGLSIEEPRLSGFRSSFGPCPSLSQCPDTSDDQLAAMSGLTCRLGVNMTGPDLTFRLFTTVWAFSTAALTSLFPSAPRGSCRDEREGCPVSGIAAAPRVFFVLVSSSSCKLLAIRECCGLDLS